MDHQADKIRKGDVKRILERAQELDPDERWQARFRLWAPGCSSTAVSMQCCLGKPLPPLSRWTLADILEFKVETGIMSERAAVARARELWSRWIDSDETKVTPEYEGGDP